MPLIEIKDFDTLIDNQLLFDQLFFVLENKQEAYEKLAQLSRNDDYTKRNLIDYLCYQKY